MSNNFVILPTSRVYMWQSTGYLKSQKWLKTTIKTVAVCAKWFPVQKVAEPILFFKIFALWSSRGEAQCLQSSQNTTKTSLSHVNISPI